MTPKEKANELIIKFSKQGTELNEYIQDYEYYKCKVLLCVDEIITELETCENFYKENSYYRLRINFLNKVKSEILDL